MKRGILLALIGLALMIASALPASAANVSVYNCCGPVTAFGDLFRPMEERTAAAYPIWPYGSVLQVCMPAGTPCTTVTVTDSTPTPWTWDISWLAGQDLGLTDGIGRCECIVTPLYIPS